MNRFFPCPRPRRVLVILISVCLAPLAVSADAPAVEEAPSAHMMVSSIELGDGNLSPIVVPPGVTSVRVVTGADEAEVTPLSLEAQPPMWEPVNEPSCLFNWTNSGGNAGRYGQSDEVGPADDGPEQLWPPIRSSLIAYQPVIENSRVFVVRIKDFGTSEDPDDSPIVALDLDSGAELWHVNLPNNTGEWTTWIAGVANSIVFASRSGNGGSVAAKVYALDAATGSTIWESEDTTTAGPYCGVVFAPDGDPIIGSNIDVKRIDAATGATVWSTSRNCSVSGQCGAAISGDGVYVVEVVAGGQAITRLDLATGARQYQSPVMGPAFTTVQNTPMAGPDGSLYLSRTMNNPTNDRFFAFRDTGTEIVAKWDVPAGWSTSSEFAIGDDGSVYMEAPGDEFVRLDPDDGSVTATTGVLAGFGSPRVAIDGAGNVYLSNKSFADGRVYAFTDDLQPIWDAAVTNINIGGPALGRYGTLVVVGNGTIGRAYRLSGAAPACPDLFSDGYETGTTELWSDQEPEP